MLDSKDLDFLDAIPLSEEEQHGQTGPNKNQCQPACKTLCDLKFLMLYITDKVVAAGSLADVMTMASVVDMFSVLLQNLVGEEICRRNGSQLHRRSEADPKTNDVGGSGENVVLVYEIRLQKQQKLNGQWMSRRWWWYVVMEHMPKPQRKLRWTLHFSVWVVVGSGFLFLFPLKI